MLAGNRIGCENVNAFPCASIRCVVCLGCWMDSWCDSAIILMYIRAWCIWLCILHSFSLQSGRELDEMYVFNFDTGSAEGAPVFWFARSRHGNDGNSAKGVQISFLQSLDRILKGWEWARNVSQVTLTKCLPPSFFPSAVHIPLPFNDTMKRASVGSWWLTSFGNCTQFPFGPVLAFHPAGVQIAPLQGAPCNTSNGPNVESSCRLQAESPRRTASEHTCTYINFMFNWLVWSHMM